VCADTAANCFNSSREELQFQESDHTGQPCLPGYNRYINFYFMSALMLYVLRAMDSSLTPVETPEEFALSTKAQNVQGWVSGRLHIHTIMISER